MNDLKGKVALVTGGTRGIGKAIVDALRARGCDVVASGSKFADLSVRHERHDMIRKIVDETGRIDILVNNAGEQTFCSAIDFPALAWDHNIDLMLTAPFDLAQQAARYMMRSGGGRIINISSVAGITGTRGIIGYSVAKAGLIEMTKCLSNEWLPYGITVNAIAPGFIETAMQDALTPEHKKAMLGRLPAGRFGTVGEVASAVGWLASDEARYVSGICLPVDGGWLAR